MNQRVFAILTAFFLTMQPSFSQPISRQLDQALSKLSIDDQFKHAVVGMYVINSKTGEIVYDHNSQLGMAPASCQKVITSVSAFEFLGSGYRYKTFIDVDKSITNGRLEGNLYIKGGGDPTLGSARWNHTSESMVLKKTLGILQKNKIHSIAGGLVCDDMHFTNQQLPNGWIWEDIGNYYGAGAWGLNWRENQYDITFKTGKDVNDVTVIQSTVPGSMLLDYKFTNFIKTGSKNSGDNGYLFSSPYQQNIVARGTVPMSEKGFTISGSIPDPPSMFIKTLRQYLNENAVIVTGDVSMYTEDESAKLPGMKLRRLDSLLSPPLDSINYWFLKKSVNLFGEALVKAIAYEKLKPGNTDSGLALIKEFWSKRGIEKAALKMLDGSGLSPANRITTHALVTVMQFARDRPWFASFYNALPEMNGIKMKDGYISGVRSYIGYIKSKDGTVYTFAFIVNNFDGNPGTVREKMWKLLDLLK